eukprot:4878520-Ditylum_brightwellii.AAC.1
MVYFSDDDITYMFTVVTASSNKIIVSGDHIRSSSLGLMKSSSGSMSGSDLALLGSEYVISGLEAGRRYFVRVSAENSEMGPGLPTPTYPPSEIPMDVPSPPLKAFLHIVDKHTLQIDWSDSHLNNPGITSYTVECFTKSSHASTSLSFFGSQGIVDLDSSGLGITGGSFTLYFGDISVELPGTVEVVNGLDYVTTTTDLAPYISRGDEIKINGNIFTVHEWKEFSSKRLPLSSAYSGKNYKESLIFTRSKSAQIPFDASAMTLKIALQNMIAVGQVDVRRDTALDGGFKWTITFLTNMGPQPLFSIDASRLFGTNPSGFKAREIVHGELPNNYKKIVLPDTSVTSINITGL